MVPRTRFHVRGIFSTKTEKIVQNNVGFEIIGMVSLKKKITRDVFNVFQGYTGQT